MKIKITKKVKQELKNLLDTSNYWNVEVRLFLEQFDYTSRQKLNMLAHAYVNNKESAILNYI